MASHISYLQSKDQLKWHGTHDDLVKFLAYKLDIESGEIRVKETGTCTVFKTEDITFNLYTKTKTLQIQGRSGADLKSELVSLATFPVGDQPLQEQNELSVMMADESSRSHQFEESENFNDSRTVVEPPRPEESLINDSIILIPQEPEALNVNSTLLSVCEEIKFLKSEFMSLKDAYSNSNSPAVVSKPLARKSKLLEHAKRSKKTKALKNEIADLNSKLEVKNARIEELESERNSLIKTVQLLSLQCKPVDESVTVERCSSTDLVESTVHAEQDCKQLNLGPNNQKTKPTGKKKPKRKSKPSMTERNNDAGVKQPNPFEPANSTTGTIVLLGDSMVKGVPGWIVGKELSRRFVVKPFPGARVQDMRHYVKPTLDQNPDEIVLHCGTNDLKEFEPKAIAEGLVDIARSVEASSSTKVTISELVTRADPSLDAKVKATNKRLRKLCNQNGWGFISHRNISVNNLNRGGLHLAASGNKTLLSNFINFFKSD